MPTACVDEPVGYLLAFTLGFGEAPSEPDGPGVQVPMVLPAAAAAGALDVVRAYLILLVSGDG